MNKLKLNGALVVGSKSADPVSGVEGEIYYNSTLQKLRQYVNGNWQDVGAGTAPVVSVNSKTGAVTLNTDDINEGSSNLYFTNARAQSAAVVNNLFGNETDQAPSVDVVKTELNNKQDVANKSNATDLGGAFTSDTLYPSQKAVKTYVDAEIAGVDALPDQTGNNGMFLSTNGTAPSWNPVVTSVNANSGAITLDTDDISEGSGPNKYFTDARAQNAVVKSTLGGGETDMSPSVGAVDLALSGKQDSLNYTPEDEDNKSDNTSLGTSDVLYPTQNAVKTYVDGAVSAVVFPVTKVNNKTGDVTLTSDDVAEGISNKYYTDARAKTAAVVDSLAGNETDQAPSVDAVKGALANKANASSLANYFKHDGSVKATGDFDLDGKAITNLKAPANDGDAATKKYIDDEIAGLPDPIVYKGTWDADTNTPDIDNTGLEVAGALYRVTVAGTYTFTNGGAITFNVGDKAVFDGTVWEKWDVIDADIDLDDLQNVTISNPQDAQVLSYNDVSEKWENKAIPAGYITSIDDTGTVDLDVSSGELTAEVKITATQGNVTLSKETDGLKASVNLSGKEDVSNKSTATDLGDATPSDTLYPSQKAVKTYVDGELANKADASSLADYFKKDGSVKATSDFDMDSNKIINVLDPSNAQDAATKKYVDDEVATKLEKVEDDTTPKLGGDLDLNGKALEDDTNDVLLAGKDSVKRAKQASKANFIEEEYIHAISLAASKTDEEITELTVAIATFDALEIAYKLNSDGEVRIGTLRIVSNGTTANCCDTYTESGITDFQFNAELDSGDLKVTFTSGSEAGTMRADVKKFLA